MTDTNFVQGAFNVYTDGGLLSSNPSSIGGTFAFCFTDMDDEFIQGDAGMCITTLERERIKRETPHNLMPYIKMGSENKVKVPALFPATYVTPDITEMMAMLYAISYLPPGWEGNFFADNQNALMRLFGDFGWEGVPIDVRKMAEKKVAKLGRINPVLLNGHPNRKDLQTGFRVNKNGIRRPCSVYNKLCDTQCKLMTKFYREQMARDAQVQILSDPLPESTTLASSF